MVTPEVLEAKLLMSEMLRWESRGPGDYDNAMRRLAYRHKIEYGAIWSLRYRKTKRIWADILTSIKAGHAAERQRLLRKLENAIAETEALAPTEHSSTLDAAKDLVRRSEAAAFGVRYEAEASVAPSSTHRRGRA